MKEDTPWRLFLGLWPGAEEQAALRQHLAQWQWPPQARRTPPERLHITLHFIGDVPAERVPLLRRELAVPWAGCMLRLDRAEVWPGGIAVLEAQTVPDALADLQVRLAEALVRLELPVESRRYRPHVTLARKARGARPPAADAITWSAPPGYLLLRSVPGGGGYVPLQAFG
ncbi:MAG TPA: RNA 2',3'-cyclic phosphodiesterase [Ramlibacter sp.]|nr:RNA 2',3'-cyclic phosphodiesterase [Ramlibacter sp.]